MRAVTDQEVSAALADAAEPAWINEQGWLFSSGGWHSGVEARRIVRFCLMLDVPVSDVIRGDLFAALVDSVAETERRLDALEERHGRPA